MGFQTLFFLASMSHLVSNLVPSRLIFLYDGSGAFVFGGSSQSSCDYRILSPGSSSTEGGGGCGDRLSGASPSSVFVSFT